MNTDNFLDFLHKTENIKLLREYFALQFNDIKENLENLKTQKLLSQQKYKNLCEQVTLSLNTIKDNLQNIDLLISSFETITTIDNDNTTSNNNSLTQESTENDLLKNNIRNLLRLEIISNLFATEFIYLSEKLKTDIAQKKVLPKKELQNDINDIKFSLKITENYIEQLQKLIKKATSKPRRKKNQNSSNIKKKAKNIKDF